MNRKSIVIGVLVLLVVIGALIFAKDPIVKRFGTQEVKVPQGSPNGNDVYSPTHALAPTTIIIPDTTTQNLPKNIAIPDKVVPSQTANSSLRVFEVSVNGNKFTPDTVTVKQNDTVRVSFTAVDKDYDFVQPDMGFNFQIPKGSTKNLDFSPPNTGKFTFYCGKCGGLKSSAVGYIIVAPR